MKKTIIPYSPNYDKNIERIGEHSDTCIVCGKRTSSGLTVHLVTSGELINTEEEVENSQGFFPIGLDCAKLLDKEFIFKP